METKVSRNITCIFSLSLSLSISSDSPQRRSPNSGSISHRRRHLDQIGFVEVGDDSGDEILVMGLDKGEVFVGKERLFSRVLKISVADLRVVSE